MPRPSPRVHTSAHSPGRMELAGNVGAVDALVTALDLPCRRASFGLVAGGGEQWAMEAEIRLFRPRSPLPRAAERFWAPLGER
jgi:hypothetical protein